MTVCRRCELLKESLRAATSGERRGIASPQNYVVYDQRGDEFFELENGLSRDEAIGFARGLERAGTLYGGGSYNPVVRCGAWVLYPEDRYGEVVDEEPEQT